MSTSSSPADTIIENDHFQRIRQQLLSWYHVNARKLPWRETRNPYHILVSEVMLQQTQVDRVIPYYHAFLEQFPTITVLASAPTAEVIRIWAGLGYNRRAISLQRTAQEVVTQFDGEFPTNVDQLRQLPGIGPYTAGAIACFAFEQPVSFLDTNMRRVVHRLLVGADVPTPMVSDRQLIELAEAILPPDQSWVWNQALIEFGALQCTARKPACLVCPLQAECAAFPTIQTVLAQLPKGVRLKREAPFEGSNRFYRGRVIAALREHPADDNHGLHLSTLGSLVREDFTVDHLPWLREIVQGLAKDGLALIAEDSPSYDATTNDVRIRLP